MICNNLTMNTFPNSMDVQFVHKIENHFFVNISGMADTILGVISSCRFDLKMSQIYATVCMISG